MRTASVLTPVARCILTGLAAWLAAWQPHAHAQTPNPEQPAPITDPPRSEELLLPAGSEVRLRLTQEIDTRANKRGDLFTLEVAAPVTLGDQLVIPAGARAEGEIIHVAKAGSSGRAAELIATARRVRIGDREVRLRNFLAENGKGRTDLAAAVGISVGLPGLLIKGGQIVLPEGTEVTAVTASDVLLLPITAEPEPEIPTDE